MARRVRAVFVAGMVGALLCLPLVRAGASGEVVLTGWVRHDHGDTFDADRTVEYTVLDTGAEQLNLVGGPARTLAPGTKVRVRGTRTGDRLVLNPRQAVTTLASGQSTSGPTMQAEAQLTAAGKMARRVAVLLINFSQPTPTPPPTPTPTPTPLPSGSPQPSASPLPTQTAQPTESPPIDANEASPSPASPAPTPTPTVVPTPTVAPTPTVDPTPSPSPTASPPPEPWTPETVRGMYFTNSRSVASYYADLSEGMMSIAGDVYGWYTVPADTTDCHYNGWATAAKDAAAQHGVDLSAYTNVVYAFPKQSVCWWSGLANVTGRNSWINGSMSLFVTSHELGHNFGVHHASSLTCKKGGARVAFSSNCTSDEYGDPFDIMGYHGQRLMSNWHRWQIGFLSAADVQTVVVDGTYRVATAETAGLSPRIVRIPRPGGDYYYLEYRQPYGEWDDFKSTAAVVNGVTIRIAPDVSKVIQSQLIDTHPETSTFGDASLGLAETYGDDINRIYVTTVALDPSGASVLVHFGPDTSPPTSPSQLHATTPADGSVALAWQKSADDRWVAGYRIERDGQALGTTLGTSFVDVPAQQARSYAYRVVAIDEAGNESNPAMLGVYVPDTSRPTTPADLTASLTGTNTVELTWTAASDNVGVALYRIAVDGSDLADTTQPPYGDIVVADGMAHVFAVRALDAAGNTSDPAEVVQLVPDATPPELVGPLSADVRPDGSVQLSWPSATDNVGVDRYELWRDGSSLTATGSAGFIDAGPAQGAWHSYQVRAVDGAALFSEPITTSVYVPDTVAPVGPGALDVWLSDPDTAALSWTPAVDNVGTDHYLVSQDGQQLSATAQTWLGGVAVRQGQTSTFGVTAYDAAGNAGPTVSTTIDVPDVTPPTAGVLSASAAGPTAVSLTWTAATDNVGLAGYKLFRDGQVIASLAADASAFADGPLGSDRTYSYILCALDVAGNIADRAASVTLVSKDVTAPSRPATLVATPLGHRRIGLQWAASSDDRPGTLRYQVFRGRKKIATVTTTSFEDRPSVVKIYKYKVRAVDAAGNKSPFSPTVSVKAARRV